MVLPHANYPKAPVWAAFLFAFSMVFSCTPISLTSEIANTPGLFYGESRLSKNEKVKIIDYSESKDVRSPLIIRVGPGELAKEITKANSSRVVYFFQPNCTSEACVSLDLLKDKLSAQKVELAIVALYFSDKLFKELEFWGSPIFIQSRMGGSLSIVDNNNRKFLQDLGAHLNQAEMDVETQFIYYNHKQKTISQAINFEQLLALIQDK